MRTLTAPEEKLLLRYLKLVQKHDRFLLFKQSRIASNMMLDAIEPNYRKATPTDLELCYLQGINRRRSKNFAKLRGLDGMIRFAHALRQRTLKDLGIGAST
jgi:hypothetical protein